MLSLKLYLYLTCSNKIYTFSQNNHSKNNKTYEYDNNTHYPYTHCCVKNTLRHTNKKCSIKNTNSHSMFRSSNHITSSCPVYTTPKRTKPITTNPVLPVGTFANIVEYSFSNRTRSSSGRLYVAVRRCLWETDQAQIASLKFVLIAIPLKILSSQKKIRYQS